MKKTYELFKGEELNIAEKIQQRRLQILVHSCIYYQLNTNLISDKQWDTWARELVELQKEYPTIASQVIWNDAFKDFDASTGFNLPITDSWVMSKAQQLLGIKKEAKKDIEKPKKAVKRRLF